MGFEDGLPDGAACAASSLSDSTAQEHPSFSLLGVGIGPRGTKGRVTGSRQLSCGTRRSPQGAGRSKFTWVGRTASLVGVLDSLKGR